MFHIVFQNRFLFMFHIYIYFIYHFTMMSTTPPGTGADPAWGRYGGRPFSRWGKMSWEFPPGRLLDEQVALGISLYDVGKAPAMWLVVLWCRIRFLISPMLRMMCRQNKKRSWNFMGNWDWMMAGYTKEDIDASFLMNNIWNRPSKTMEWDMSINKHHGWPLKIGGLYCISIFTNNFRAFFLQHWKSFWFMRR